MQAELDFFWGRITMDFPPDYERMNVDLIHNPTIRYFQMVVNHTFFGKVENIRPISRE